MYRDLSAGESVVLADAGATASYRDPILSSDGDWLALSTDDDIQLNGDGNREVFLWQLSTGTASQITFTSGAVRSIPFGISTGGLVVAYVSNQTLPDNEDGGDEVWLAGVSFDPVTVSEADVEIVPGAISADGSILYFSSTGDYAGGNADGSLEIFVLEAGNPLLQLSNAPSGSSIRDTDVDGSGRFLVWRTDVQIFGETHPPEFAGVIVHRMGETPATLLGHHSPGVSIGKTRSASTGLAVFDSTEDFLGTNVDLGGEVWAIDCAHLHVFQDGFDRGSDAAW